MLYPFKPGRDLTARVATVANASSTRIAAPFYGSGINNLRGCGRSAAASRAHTMSATAQKCKGKLRRTWRQRHAMDKANLQPLAGLVPPPPPFPAALHPITDDALPLPWKGKVVANYIA